MNCRVLSPAIEEIASAAIWFEQQTPGLGTEFWRLVDQVLSEIEARPLRFAKSDFATPEIDLRFAYVERFKYVVHFAIEPEEILIVAVTHAAREPGYWLGRLRH